MPPPNSCASSGGLRQKLQKAKGRIRRDRKESEMKPQWSRGDSAQQAKKTEEVDRLEYWNAQSERVSSGSSRSWSLRRKRCGLIRKIVNENDCEVASTNASNA